MRVAIVGTGGIARVHRRIIGELGGELVGVSGRSKAAAAAFSGVPAYEDVEAMLAEQKPDVLHVCTPNHLHERHALAGFAAGAHVLCEKPLATSVAAAERMIEAAHSAGRVGAVA